jgi:hypothetical protein
MNDAHIVRSSCPVQLGPTHEPLSRIAIEDLLIPMRRIHNRIHSRIICQIPSQRPTLHLHWYTDISRRNQRTEIRTHIRRLQHLDRQVLIHLAHDLDGISGLEVGFLWAC